MTKFEEDVLELLRRIVKHLLPPKPISIRFKEISMNPVAPGETLVFTGTLSPAGAVYPAGTTFQVTSSDSSVTPTVDETGLIVTVPLPATWTPDMVTISYEATDGTDFLSQAIVLTPTVAPPPPPPPAFPTGIAFAQTQ